MQLYPQGSATILPLILSIATTLCLFLSLSHERNFFCVNAQSEAGYPLFFSYPSRICSPLHFGIHSYQTIFLDNNGDAVVGYVPKASNLRASFCLSGMATIIVFCVSGILASGTCFPVSFLGIRLAQTVALLLQGVALVCILMVDGDITLDDGAFFSVMVLLLLFASLALSFVQTKQGSSVEVKEETDEELAAVAAPPASSGWNRVGK